MYCHRSEFYILSELYILRIQNCSMLHADLTLTQVTLHKQECSAPQFQAPLAMAASLQ